MKKAEALGILVLFVALQGCSREVNDDLKEAGNDAKRDMNKAAQNIEDTVQDAVE
jgi:hypothetical protein